MKKRILSMLLAMIMVVGMLPTVALAADTYTYPTSQPTLTWTGSGTEADPYVITTAQQLADLAWLVNNNMSAYQSAYYKLGGNIDLSGGTWTPIGYQASRNAARYFSGTFDGGSNTISGLNNVTCSGEKYVGLFGAVNSGTVKNLTVSGTFTTSYQYSAGICAYASKSTFENCVSQVNITCTSTSTPNLGGIIGYGSIDMVIRNCTNSGTISYTGSSAGYISGICGHIGKGSVVSGCSNSGAVTGKSSGNNGTGGIVGYINGSGAATNTEYKIENCTNSGAISGTNYVGGVVGSSGCEDVVIIGCSNSATVTGSGYTVGGICGVRRNVITDCYNTGNVTGTYNVGGICGYLSMGDHKLSNCYNAGNITATAPSTSQSGAGGIEGYTAGNKTTAFVYIDNCYNTGTVSGKDTSSWYVSGICGRLQSGILSNSHSYGTITKVSSNASYCGAIAGGSGTITNSYYLNGTDKKATQKTAEEFADGTVAKLLQEPNAELVWGQTIDTDAYPVFYNGNNSVMPTTYTVMWMVDETEYHSEDLEEGAAITAPENPAKAAVGCTTYTFANWDAEIPETMPAENLTFNAVFTEETKHTLVYTNNDDGTHSAACACGAEVIEKETHTYGEDGLCDCGEQKPEKFAITLVQAELGNDLHLYFLFPADAYDDWTGCYAVVTKTYADGRDDVTVTVPASEWTEKINGTTLKCVGFHNISAKEMADTIRIVVYNAEDEAISEEGSDSLASYLMRMLDTNTDSEFRTLAVDMLNYGAAAQTQFNYNTENLANAGLTEEQKAYGTASDAVCTNNQVKGENVRGVTVELNNNIIMNAYFTNQTADMTATVTFTNHNGNEITADLTSTESANGYCFKVNQLAVADMRALVTVTCYNADGTVYGTLTDSVESYVARTGLSKAINQAIMKFSDSAKAYLH